MASIKFLEPGGDQTFSGLDVANGGFWISSTSPTIVSDFVYSNHLRSIRAAPSTAQKANKSSVLSDSGTRISFCIYLVALPTANASIVSCTVIGSQVFSLIITTIGEIVLGSSSNARLSVGDKVLSTGQWYRVSLCYRVTSSTVNRFELRVDGVTSASATNVTLGGSGATDFSIGNQLADATLDIRFSDIYIDNEKTFVDPGNIIVMAKRPVSNGSVNGFTTQIGSGGSGYGTGHSSQVNERALSTTNGWSMVGAGSAVTEEYTIEDASTGDFNANNLGSQRSLLGFMGWVYCSSLAGETGQIIVGGVQSNIAILTTNKLFMSVVNSSVYPTGGTDIGIITDTSLTTVSLYECGIVFAYVVDVPSKLQPINNLRPRPFAPGIAR